MSNRDTTLEAAIKTACRERNIDNGVLRAVLRDFLGSLHEAQFRSSYRPDGGSLIAQVDWALGDEAAFGLLDSWLTAALGPPGAGTVYTTLEYVDAAAKRFGTMIQRWKLEVDAEIAEGE